MAAPFAILEARSTAAVFRHIPNAQAQAVTRYGEAVSFPVIFDNGYTGLLGDRMASAQPQAQASTEAVADLAQECLIAIKGLDYRVVSIQPDGTGMSTLLLELHT